MLNKIKKLPLYKFLIVAVLGLASFLRFFRLNELLGFWYDQGRDALVIWDMLYNGKFTLIGPMMGFTGMFRGAWYYWLIAPLYALGHGNPIYPSVFLVLTTIAAIFLLYKLGKEIGGEKTGIFAALIASVSVYLIGSSRWLSDPTPTLLISTLLLWSLFQFLQGKKWALPLSGFLAGMALQFSAAAEVYYVPALILIVWIFKKKVRVDIKNILLAVFAFAFAFTPQLLFELRHPGVQSGALYNFIFNEKTFTFAFWDVAKTRLVFDYNMFASKFWINGGTLFTPFFALLLIFMILNWKKLWKSDKFKILFILAIAPFIGTLFFVSNLGGVYEYYFTGYYLIWILLFAFVYMNSSKNVYIKIAIFAFCLVLLAENLRSYKNNYLIPTDQYKTITLSSELKAIDWVYKQAGVRDFNVDVYVPPVIPYAYDYLFKWTGETKYNKLPKVENIDLLYTLYETDTDHPERLNAWLERQKGIGTVIKEEKFDMIVVQERQRIKTK